MPTRKRDVILLTYIPDASLSLSIISLEAHDERSPQLEGGHAPSRHSQVLGAVKCSVSEIEVYEWSSHARSVAKLSLDNWVLNKANDGSAYFKVGRQSK